MGGKSGGGSGPGGWGNGNKNYMTSVDAATLGLSGATNPSPMLPLQSPSANPLGAMNPDMMAMMAMAGALGGDNQSNANTASNQQQLMQMMSLVQAGNAAQQATAAAKKQKVLNEAAAKATQDKTTHIATLEAKLSKKQKVVEADTDPEEGDGDEDDESTVVKVSQGEKKKMKLKDSDKTAKAQAEKADLEIELAKARAEAEVATQKASLMESTIQHLKADDGEGSTPRLCSASDGAIQIQDKILKAEEKAKLTTPVKKALDEIVAAQLAAIGNPPVVTPINLTINLWQP